jgi:hypothetical protein
LRGLHLLINVRRIEKVPHKVKHSQAGLSEEVSPSLVDLLDPFAGAGSFSVAGGAFGQVWLSPDVSSPIMDDDLHYRNEAENLLAYFRRVHDGLGERERPHWQRALLRGAATQFWRFSRIRREGVR